MTDWLRWLALKLAGWISHFIRPAPWLFDNAQDDPEPAEGVAV